MEKQIKGYNAIKADDPTELSSLIQAAINEGWQPFGSIAIGVLPSRIYYVQALVKYEG
ncbi:DUF1737 domain-containing protein [Spirosoma endophyticum]|uniref:DUF1737 domain-containing protein n=1 Tax=Spirosoma endophyticum TaxID=662367 RepID=A0A1I2H7L6_9BACT|nr:DUF1737 domain-containing protein [Spirosoma endophyticum]SFD43737.1 protein of unknown function [Spirosoma endophyticum]SFF26165.1 protein of unknown function [Spirosoma endophyticum]